MRLVSDTSSVTSLPQRLYEPVWEGYHPSTFQYPSTASASEDHSSAYMSRDQGEDEYAHRTNTNHGDGDGDDSLNYAYGEEGGGDGRGGGRHDSSRLPSMYYCKESEDITNK